MTPTYIVDNIILVTFQCIGTLKLCNFTNVNNIWWTKVNPWKPHEVSIIVDVWHKFWYMLLRNQLYKQQYDSTRCVKVSHSLSKYGTASSFYDARPTFSLHYITLKYNSKCQYNICCSTSVSNLHYWPSSIINPMNENTKSQCSTHMHIQLTQNRQSWLPWMCGVWRIVWPTNAFNEHIRFICFAICLPK